MPENPAPPKGSTAHYSGKGPDECSHAFDRWYGNLTDREREFIVGRDAEEKELRHLWRTAWEAAIKAAVKVLREKPCPCCGFWHGPQFAVEIEKLGGGE